MPIWSGWQNKPPPGTPIDWNHPYAVGLVAAWIFNTPGPPIELVGQRAASASTAYTTVSDINGFVGSFNGSSTNASYNGVPAMGPGMSLAGACSLTTVSSNFMLIERESVNATWAILGESSTLKWRGADGNFRNQFSISGVSNKQRFSWAFTDVGNAGTAISSGYLNGVSVGSAGVSNAPAASNTNLIHLGNYDNSGYFLGGTQDYIYIWNWAIPADMAVNIGFNPWQIFQEPSPSLLFSSSISVVTIPYHPLNINQAVTRAAYY